MNSSYIYVIRRHYMSVIKDAALAPGGRKKIEWVRSFMPTLSQIEKRFEREKPFKGMRIAVSVHLEAKTANLGLVLAKGGADVFLTGCNPLSSCCRRSCRDTARHPAT